MNLEKKLKELKSKREGALISHVYYGDPNEYFSLKLIKGLVENGTDILEFGIPFSDPTADGPIFQAACERALKNGITPTKCIQGIDNLRKIGLDMPLIVTTYYNIPYIMGLEVFLKKIKKAGAQAVIIPNLPIEEAEELLDEGRKSDIRIILQVTQTTTDDRLKRITDVASGFIYIISVEGVTGTRKKLNISTLKLIKRVKQYTDIPVLVGFGVSKKEHAISILSAGADGVIVGSAYAEIYGNNLKKKEEALIEISLLSKEIKSGCIEGFAK